MTELLKQIVPTPKMAELYSVSIALFIIINRLAFGFDFDCEEWLLELEDYSGIKIADKMKCNKAPGIMFIGAIIVY